MRAALRFLIAAPAVALALGQAPLLAQAAPPPADAPAPSESIGPRELENFSLNGTVTRPAPTPLPPAPTPTRPSPKAAAPAQSSPSAATPRERPVTGAVTVSAAREPSLTVTLPPAEALSDAPTPAPSTEVPAVESDFAAAEDSASPSAPSLGVFPWLIALILLGGAAGYYFWRQRGRPSYATAGGYDSFAAGAPAPSPLRRSPSPAPAPSTSGVVSTRLRPWLDIEFEPARCVVEEDNARIEFDISVFNSGSAPARDVLIEAGMFNAGPTQDQEIGAFFAHPVAKGERIPVIPPLKRVALKSAVSLTHAELRQFEAAGRRFFVPLLAFNTLYRWSAGDGQTSTSYLVGRDTQGEKMAPFRLDLGPRIFRGLGAREHNIGMRK